MFELLLVAGALLCIAAIVIAFDGSRDVFHPLLFVGPMFLFLYTWMPAELLHSGGLANYFDDEQLVFVHSLNLLGMLAFVAGVLWVGLRSSSRSAAAAEKPRALSAMACRRLLVGGAIAGSLGLLCWAITIVNVGGFVNAFSRGYAGGWDDSGYVRDGTLLLLVGVLLSITSLSSGGPRLWSLIQMAIFGLPWSASALLMGRRGPTFALCVVLLMGWYLPRGKRPPVAAMGAIAVCLGWLVLFLVTNRSNIYLGSDKQLTTDVTDVVNKAQTGNEYIYGSGSVLSAHRRDHYFWMRRYLAQVLVRPIPSAVWPTKYEDFGVPELLQNAGTGEGFGDALGWQGAPGSAPGIIADLWVEAWWFAVPLMGLLGLAYGSVWKRAVRTGDRFSYAWTSQYIVLSALSIYLVMQTMEAVIFRTILLSAPCWLTWRWALAQPGQRVSSRVRPRRYLRSDVAASQGLREGVSGHA